MVSKWEGFGLAAVEAMNSGLPSVLSKVEGLKDLSSEVNLEAFLVDSDNEEQISEKLRLLINDYNLRIIMGEKGFKVSQSYNIKDMIEQYFKLYSKLSSSEEQE